MLRVTEGQTAAGRWARRQRERLGLDQEAVADSAGVSPTTLRQFELGRSWPRAGSRQVIERALKLNDGDLAEYAYWYDQELENQPGVDEHVRMAQRVMDRLADERRAQGE